MQLVLPDTDLFPAFQRMIADFEQHHEARFEKERNWGVKEFKRYINRLNNHRKGINLPLGRMPEAVYWLLNQKQDIVAIGSIRLRMNAHLLKEGGQIGYTVVPGFRQKGIGTFLLGELLKKAREFELDRILITCNEDNIASRKIIEKNGGIYDNTIFSMEKNALILRYWINI